MAKILLIEDDPDTIRLFREILAESGFEAQGVSHDRLPASNGFGLVITDLDMRGKGYSSSEARAWVRMVGGRYRVPVLVITGHSEAVLDDAMRIEAVDIIAKPLDIDDLQRRVAAALSTRRISPPGQSPVTESPHAPRTAARGAHASARPL